MTGAKKWLRSEITVEFNGQKKYQRVVYNTDFILWQLQSIFKSAQKQQKYGIHLSAL